MAVMEREQALVPDAWLAARLGVPAFRVVDPNALLTQGQGFAWSRLPANDRVGRERLESSGFKLAETTITLERRRPASVEMPPNVRLATPQDADEIAALAGRGFSCTRFHSDRRVPAGVADRIKADWARAGALGERGDVTLVVTNEAGAIVGFIIMLNPVPQRAVIDLVAVDAGSRRSGLARALTDGAWAAMPKATHMQVGTQSRNLEAMACYARLGFSPVSESHVMHRWETTCTSEATTSATAR